MKTQSIKVIYEKNTRRVIITECGGVWTLPTGLEVEAFPIDSEIFVENGGDLYLKAQKVH